MAFNPFDLTGKVALVTGGNRGIGLGMAEALARAGADVAIWGTNADHNARAEARLRAHGRRVLVQACNVADEARVDAAMADLVATFGRLDCCIANAGVSSGKNAPFTEMTTEEWRRVLSINLDGAFFTLRAAARAMTAAGNGGSLVGIASTAAIEGAARNEHYAATKGGLNAMIKALAVELARHRIRANAILPGWIETDMTANAIANPKFEQAVMARIPARRWGSPDDFGGIAVYLAADASSYHTGDLIVIDGGYTIF